MSETNGYATLDSFKAASARRFAEPNVDGVGRLCLRSLNGLEFSKVKSAMQRRALAVRDGKSTSAKTDESIEYVLQCVVDHETKQPLFSESDRDAVAQWDVGLLEHVAQLCADHCDFPDEDQTVKN